MKHIYFVALMTVALVFAQTVFAAEANPPADQPQWLTSFEEAKKASEKSGKPILANFTGSDWCLWCSNLRQEVFDTQEFKKWAAEKVILLEVDFPKQKEQDPATKQANRALAKQYGIMVIPTVVFIKADGTEIGKIGYLKGGQKVWTEKAQEILDEAHKVPEALNPPNETAPKKQPGGSIE